MKKQQQDAKDRKEMASRAAKGGPLVGGGIKKYAPYLFIVYTYAF